MRDVTTAPSPAATDAAKPWFERNYFLLRRLHSLTGIVPVGVFLLFHLTTNGSVVWGLADSRKQVYGDAGIATFQHEVDFIHSTPFLLLLEVFGIWAPLAFHTALGVYYATTGRPNVRHYPYPDNWRYTWQRITAWVGLFFIFWHVATLRWGWTILIPANWGAEPGKAMAWDADFAGSSMAAIMQGSSNGMTGLGALMTVVYGIGVAAVVFHLANGLWTAAITWGLTVSDSAQRRWGRVCLALGAGLMAMGLGSVVRFATLNVEHARQTEIRLKQLHAAPTEPGPRA